VVRRKAAVVVGANAETTTAVVELFGAPNAAAVARRGSNFLRRKAFEVADERIMVCGELDELSFCSGVRNLPQSDGLDPPSFSRLLFEFRWIFIVVVVVVRVVVVCTVPLHLTVLPDCTVTQNALTPRDQLQSRESRARSFSWTARRATMSLVPRRVSCERNSGVYVDGVSGAPRSFTAAVRRRHRRISNDDRPLD